MDYVKQYADFLRGFLDVKRPIKIVFDCSNGTTGIVLRKLFPKSMVNGQMSIVLINGKPDGNFPGHGPNPLAEGAMEKLQSEVKKQKADMGAIFDADGDRVFFIDNRGAAVSSDEVGYALMQKFKPPYPINVNSSWLLKKLNVKGQMSKVYVSRTGHFFLKNIMRKNKSEFGAEFSGHFYYKDFFYCDSGIFTAVQMINFISGLKTDFASWRDKLPKYCHSGEINLKVADKAAAMGRLEKKYKNKAKLISKLDGIWMEFSPSPLPGRLHSKRSVSQPGKGEGWWFNARPSNTEDILRLSVEAMSKKKMEKKLEEIKRIILRNSIN